MKKFTNDNEKFEFLKKYRLMAKTHTELPSYYYYRSGSSVPELCEIVGQDGEYDSWAVVVISINGKNINIHSDHLRDMKDAGNKYFKETALEQHTPSESDDTYIVFDLETTGRNHFHDEIIELGALKVSSSGITEFSELVKPDGIIPIDITAITGISNEMVYNARPISEVLPDFLAFIGDCKLVGHNIAAFDNYFINDACKKCGYPELINPFVDTLQLSRQELNQLSHHKLSDLCEYYGIDNSEAHRALADCYMCNEIYIRLLSDDINSDSMLPLKEDSWTQSSDNPFLQKIIDSLKQICTDKELIPGSLRMVENENMNLQSYSILAYEYAFPIGAYKNIIKSFMKIAFKRTGIDLEFQKHVYDALSWHPEFIKYSERKDQNTGNTMAIITFGSPTDELQRYICDIVLYRLSIYRTRQSSFGCCDRFKECSHALKCVHENKLYSTACNYRHNLENGQVFYGKS